ncbi:MAG: MATE family efflux transporter [Clostridium sp.]|nr:MATE family efflux transporter [Clostridium sp.]
MKTKNDFTKGNVGKNIIKLALPMTLAQLINILYNVVDRIFIGRMPETGTLALTGLGLTFPIITIVLAFANLVGLGGAPLSSIERGKGNIKKAELIMGNSFTMLISLSIFLTIIGYMFKEPVLLLFGASNATLPYANDYLTIYLVGTVFVLLGLGMNSYINAQGFAKIGMLSVALGAIINLILDPIFIYVLNMGVSGAALATIISQCCSCIWILKFLTGKNTILKLKISCMKLDRETVKEIISLGLSGFVMALTNSSVQVVCNSTLSLYGGDIYIGVMTVINSIREIAQMPIGGISSGAQPVLSFNYGAKENKRVIKGIKFMTIVCIIYTSIAWFIADFRGEFFIRLFNDEPELIKLAVPCLSVYFFGYFMMSFQFSGQSTFVALGKSKQAIFFSIFRKVIIVVPLTILLPKMGFGSMGVFIAEPISNFVGGLACFITMLLTVGRELKNNTNEGLDTIR